MQSSKPHLGASLYPGFAQEIPSCVQEGSLVFTSAHIPELESNPESLKNLVDQLHERKAKVICDVDDQTAQKYGYFTLIEFAQAMNLDCLRLDFGFSLEEIDEIASKLSVALNASTIDTQTKRWLIGRHPEILFVHNFYPRPETGLDLETFLAMSEGVPAANLAVFIAGDECLRGPLYQGLPTLESQRKLPPYVAYCQLKQMGIEKILVGDPGLSLQQLDWINQAIEGIYSIPVLFDDPAFEVYAGKVFTIRTDSPKRLRRLAESRQMQSDTPSIPPFHTTRRVRGSICQDNEGYGRYAGEIMLAAGDYPADEKVNVIGHVHPDYLPLLDCIDNGARIQLFAMQDGACLEK